LKQIETEKQKLLTTIDNKDRDIHRLTLEVKAKEDSNKQIDIIKIREPQQQEPTNREHQLTYHNQGWKCKNCNKIGMSNEFRGVCI